MGRSVLRGIPLPRRRRRSAGPNDAAGVLAALFGLYVLVRAVASASPAVLAALVVVIGVGTAAGTYWWLGRRRRRLAHVSSLRDLLALTPAEFELTVADLLASAGYGNVRRVGGAGDLAADIVCTDSKGRLVVVQCKRYAPGTNIGSPEIQKFIGMLTVHHRGDYGIFAATSGYTAPAEALAHRHGVVLWDGDDLARMAAAACASPQASPWRVPAAAGVAASVLLVLAAGAGSGAPAVQPPLTPTSTPVATP